MLASENFLPAPPGQPRIQLEVQRLTWACSILETKGAHFFLLFNSAECSSGPSLGPLNDGENFHYSFGERLKVVDLTAVLPRAARGQHGLVGLD